VHASLLMAEGPEAVKFAAKLADQEKKREEARENTKRVAKVSADSEETEKRKKIKLDMDRSLEPVDAGSVSFKLPIPFTLKKVLVDDWEKVTQTDPTMLVRLPRATTITQIIDDYVEGKSKKGGAAQGSHEKLVELFEGLKEYFDTCLPVTLLFR
jgi:mortality factor 4-like protein 1